MVSWLELILINNPWKTCKIAWGFRLRSTFLHLLIGSIASISSHGSISSSLLQRALYWSFHFWFLFFFKRLTSYRYPFFFLFSSLLSNIEVIGTLVSHHLILFSLFLFSIFLSVEMVKVKSVNRFGQKEGPHVATLCAY